MATAKNLAGQLVDRLERRDWEGLEQILDVDVVYELPQSRERIRGRDRYLQFNREYPGSWHISPLVVLGDDRDGCTLFSWTVGDYTVLAIVFVQVTDGRIVRITDFWPEPYDPPPGREHLTERF